MESETHFLPTFLSVFLCLHNLAVKWQPCLTSNNIKKKKKKPGRASHSRQVSMHCSVLWLLVWTGMRVARSKKKRSRCDWKQWPIGELFGEFILTHHWSYQCLSVKPTAYSATWMLLWLSLLCFYCNTFFMICLHWVNHWLYVRAWVHVCVWMGGGLIGKLWISVFSGWWTCSDLVAVM